MMSRTAAAEYIKPFRQPQMRAFAYTLASVPVEFAISDTGTLHTKHPLHRTWRVEERSRAALRRITVYTTADFALSDFLCFTTWSKRCGLKLAWTSTHDTNAIEEVFFTEI